METRLTFKTPVKVGGAQLAAVSFRTPLLEDEIAAAAFTATATALETNLRLLAAITGLSFAALRDTRAATRHALTAILDRLLLEAPPHQVERGDDKSVVTFDPPVTIGKNQVAQVTIRDPLVEEELQAAALNKTGSAVEAEARLVGIIAELPFDGLVKTASGTYRVLYAELLRFLESQPKMSIERSSTLPASARVESAGPN